MNEIIFLYDNAKAMKSIRHSLNNKMFRQRQAFFNVFLILVIARGNWWTKI